MNYTYRRIAQPTTFEKWITATPDGFVFLAQGAHEDHALVEAKRCRGIHTGFSAIIGAAARRRPPRSYPLSVPPSFKADIETLREFIALLPKSVQTAFEFRNASWFDEATYEVLRGANVALCMAENEKSGNPACRNGRFRCSSTFTKARLHGIRVGRYRLPHPAIPCQCVSHLRHFFKHEDTPAGALNAEKMLNAQTVKGLAV